MPKKEFRFVAKINGSTWETKWESLADWTIGLIDEAAKVMNEMYDEWDIEYR